jgi:hypothetical protein
MIKIKSDKGTIFIQIKIIYRLNISI